MGRLLTLLRPKGDNVLVFDTFTDADGTSLTAHVPDRYVGVVTGYAVPTGTYDIQSNTAGRATTTANRITTAAVPTDGWVGDVQASIDVAVPANGSGTDPVAVGPVVRNAGTGTVGWTAYIDRTGVASTYRIQIFQVSDITQVQRGATATPYVGGSTVTITAKIVGTVMTASMLVGATEYTSTYDTGGFLASNSHVGIAQYRDDTYKRASVDTLRAVKL